jgi:hypothetical protein
MSQSGTLVGLLLDGTDGNRFAEDWRLQLTVVTLIGCHVLDAAVAMLSVVAVNKAIDPCLHRQKIPEPPHLIVLGVYHRAEPRFGIGVTVADLGRENDSELPSLAIFAARL